MDTSTTSRTIDIRKQCAIVIRKPKLRIFDEYEALVNYIKSNPNGSQADWLQERETAKLEQTQRFQDIIFTKGIPTNDNRRILQDVGNMQGPTLTGELPISNDYWYIVANGNIDIENQDTVQTITGNPNALSSVADQSGIQQTDTVGNFSTDSDVNNSVISVSIDQTTESAWTGTITLDNSNNVYYLRNQQVSGRRPPFIFQEGDCVIESNDEIDVYLTDWRSNLKEVFTGYVNSVTTSDDGLQKRVILQCEDCTKKLSVSRTNLNPSLDPVESAGDVVTPFTLSYAIKTPDDQLRTMLGETFCTVLTDYVFIKNNLGFIDTLRNTKSATADRQSALQTFKENIVNAIKSPKYTSVVYDDNGLIKSIMGYEYTSAGLKRLKFIIEGINQPAWALEFTNGNFDIYISQWKGNDQVTTDIAERIFYEHFADENGVVHIRPTNLTLPKKLATGTQTVSSISNASGQIVMQGNTALYNQTIENYILTSDKELYIRSFNETFNDRSLFTDMVVSGQFQAGGLTPDWLRRLITAPYKYKKMYGTRMAPQETKIGAMTQDALDVYGTARLARHNSEAWTASIVMEGNSRINAGRPIFIERWQSVYYVSAVNHSFTAGGDYTTTLTLDNRRRPIDFIPTSVTNPNIIKGILTSDLGEMVARNEISNAEMNKILDGKESLMWGQITIPDLQTTIGGITLPNNSTPSTTYNIWWEPIPTIFDTGELQSMSATAERFAQILSQTYQAWQSAIIDNDPDVDLYFQDYWNVLNQAEDIFGDDLTAEQFDSYKDLVAVDTFDN